MDLTIPKTQNVQRYQMNHEVKVVRQSLVVQTIPSKEAEPLWEQI